MRRPVIKPGLRLRQDLLQHLCFDGAPLAIVRIQLLGDSQGDFGRCRRQQFHDLDAVIHPPRRIDARTKLKSNLSGSHFSRGDVGHLFERHDAGTR
jgi:hypothetical protein